MADQQHKIPLFSKQHLNLLDYCNDYFVFKIILLPFVTWLDHSILRQLVRASPCEVAKKMLEQFDSSIDYNEKFISYPIPSSSKLIIPLLNSDYTIAAIKCHFNFEEADLKKIINIRCLLTQRWKITDHAIQLIGVHMKHRILYWIIP